MVQLTIYSPKGHLSFKHFPYSGFLGLTPLKVEGYVATSLGTDRKSLPAKSITVSVRCYESRLGRVGVLSSNVLVDYSDLLWSKPDGQDYADIGDLQFPFRISLPVDVQGLSTVTFPDYRVFWRVEAVIHHAPITGVGSRQTRHHELPLVRYNLPLPYSPSSPPPILLDSQTTKLRAPVLRYHINMPTYPVGPSDLVSIPIHLLPIDPAVSVRSVSLIVERRMQLMGVSAPPSPPQTTVSMPPSPPSSIQPLLSQEKTISIPDTFRTASPSFSSTSTLAINDSRPLIFHRPGSASAPASAENHSKTVTMSIAGAESSGRFLKADNGIWIKTLTFQWPAAKSNSRWAIGETLQSEMVSVKFFAKFKIVVSSPSGTESIELADQELIVVAKNAGERELALSQYKKQVHTAASLGADKVARGKSKSPRRVPKLDECCPVTLEHSSMGTLVPGGQPTLPIYALTPRQKTASGAPSVKPRRKTSRRPHTSAGPRDKAHSVFGTSGADDDRCGQFEHDHEGEDGGRPGSGRGGSGPRWLTGTLLGGAGGGGSSAHDEELPNDKEQGPSDQVRAWELELERIELQSQQSSADMLRRMSAANGYRPPPPGIPLPVLMPSA